MSTAERDASAAVAEVEGNAGIHESSSAEGTSGSTGASVGKRSRPTEPVPTDRIAFPKQLDLLRGYAALSGIEQRPVTLAAAAQLLKMTPSTASLANGFFTGAGLLERQDSGFVPTQATIEYRQAYDWEPDGATKKLGPPLRETWAWKAIEGHLSFSELSEDEAVRALAEASGASRHYEGQLKLILAYFEAGGLIVRDATGLRVPRREPAVTRQPSPASATSTDDSERPVERRSPTTPASIPTAGSSVASTVHPALVGLLQLLPAPGAEWDRGKQEWIKAFTAAIDVVYPDGAPDREDPAETTGSLGSE